MSDPMATDVVLVGVVDLCGWVLLQERDEHAPVDPDRWTLPGGGVEDGESAADAARRGLREETGLDRDDLRPLGVRTLPCAAHGLDVVALFAALVASSTAREPAAG